ncbi:isoleucine-tRNA ligase, partial [Ceratobasidium sp. 392]
MQTPLRHRPLLATLRIARARYDFPSLRHARLLSVSSPHRKQNQNAFAETLLLPKTTFPLWADPSQREVPYKNKTTEELYKWQWEGREGSETFILHDGPPYANGSLHCGHALNKILKDIINRFHVMQGYRVHYMPGWDCHGLPIEDKALKELEGDARSVPPTIIRSTAREVALREIKRQREEFQQFGIMADWSHDGCYRTIDHEYEMRQLEVLQKMVGKGLISRRHRPVYWSPSSLSALAEAELDYVDDHKSQSVYVNLPVQTASDALAKLVPSISGPPSLMIWTTTPWTLPSNMAVAAHAEMAYSLVQYEGKLVVVSKDRLEALANAKIFGDGWEVLGELSGEAHIGIDLIGTKYKPIFGTSVCPVITAKHVTAESGTGLVHTAPAHGAEDYAAWRLGSYGEEILCPVDDEGKFTTAVGESWTRLVGKEVLGDGNIEVIRVLKELDVLVRKETLRHRYPYDWKTKKPVILRATSQWFTNLDAIKDDALEALKDVKFYPEASRARLEAFIRERSEWCISRQRTWGLPIPALHDAESDEALLTSESLEHIISVLREKGMQHWWSGPVEDFIPPSIKSSGRVWRKGTDTIDVWFDSGSSWSLIRDLNLRSGLITDVCLEGSDQHRGWFQSLLLTAVSCTDEGKKPQAPYGTLITHGFVLDASGKKMSKSQGNVISPMDIIHGGKNKKAEPAYGADVLRLWAATVEYGKDVSLSQAVLAQAAETLRKVRNSARFVLGNIGSTSSETAPNLRHGELGLLERYVMHQLYTLETTAREAYSTYNFQKVVHSVSAFTNNVCSSLYFDIMKDTLYAESPTSSARNLTIRMLREILRVFSSVVAPILPHLAEEVHAHLQPSASDSVFQYGWYAVAEEFKDPESESDMRHILAVRTSVLEGLERVRQEKQLKSALEAQVEIALPSSGPVADILRRELDNLPLIFIVSDVLLQDEAPVSDHPWSYADQSLTIGNEHITINGVCDAAELSYAPPFVMSRNPDGTFSSLVASLDEASSPPTDSTVAQFILDSTHPLRPIRDVNSPWFIEDETGRGVGYEEVRARTWGLANAIRRRWPDIVEDDVVCIFSPNNVDYPIVIWASHRLSLIVSCANPGYTEDELVYQLQATKSKLLFVHPANVGIAMKAAKKAGLRESQVISLMGVNHAPPPTNVFTIDQLVNEGIISPRSFEEKRLAPGENKTKVAFYSFSSGTTGKPKAVAIPHHAVIANIIQNAAFVRLNDPTLSPDKARYRKGDVNLGVLPMFHIYGLVYVMHFGLFAGLPLVVIPKFNFVDMLKSIVKYRITHLS